MLSQITNVGRFRHAAGIVAATLITVNALGCTSKPVPAPAEPRRWTAYLAEPSRAPSAGEWLPDSLEELWEEKVGRSPTGGAALGDSIIVTLSSDKWLVLVLRHSGTRVWRQRLKGAGATGPLFTGDRVYAASGDRRGRVHAYDLSTGDKLWDEIIGPVTGPIAVSSSTVYAATRTGWLFALDPTTGDPRWSRPFRGPLRAGVSLLDGILAVATDDSLYLVSARDGAVEASGATSGTVFSPPALADSVLLVSSPDGFITAFDSRSLEMLWELPTGEPVFGSPVVSRDTVYAATLGGTLWQIPLAGPGGARSHNLGVPVRASPTLFAGGLLIGTVEGEVLWLAPPGLEPRWRQRFRGPIEEPLLVDDGVLFILDGEGKLHAWGAPAAEQ